MWSLDQINRYQEIIDVRSPAEYQADHVCGAQNFPVLDNAERKEIGLLYKASSFAAKRRGAAIVSGRVARYLERRFQHKSMDWKPLVYCWRGGIRSAAFIHILRQVGWQADQLPGGYKAYRREVVRVLEESVRPLRFVVLCGETGVGKSELLQTLARAGEQVIDLEALAEHRGSALGQPPDCRQPTQKTFENRLAGQLHGLDRKRAVYIESESRRVGAIHVPSALVKAMRQAECWRIEAGLEARVEYLQRAYSHFISDADALRQALDLLIPFHGRKKIEAWLAMAHRGETAAMVAELLRGHYDPSYARAMQKHFFHYSKAPTIRLDAVGPRELKAAQQRLVSAVHDG